MRNLDSTTPGQIPIEMKFFLELKSLVSSIGLTAPAPTAAKGPCKKKKKKANKSQPLCKKQRYRQAKILIITFPQLSLSLTVIISINNYYQRLLLLLDVIHLPPLAYSNDF